MNDARTKDSENVICDHEILHLEVDTLLTKPNYLILQVLHLKNSNIKSLPEDFFSNFCNLKWLDLRDNFISHIPRSVENHRKLETILFSNNLIKYLPTELCTVDNLKYLQASRNPLIFPKYSILNCGIRVLKDYLRYFYKRQIDVEKNPNSECDPMLLGRNEYVKPSRNDQREDGAKAVDNYLTGDAGYETKIIPNRSKIDANVDDGKKVDVEKNAEMNSKCKLLKNKRGVIISRPLNKNEMTKRIKQTAHEELIADKRKQHLTDIEGILQKRKNSNELKKWRDAYRNEKYQNREDIKFLMDVAKFPFGTSEEHGRILNRKQILLIQNSLNEKKTKKSLKIDVKQNEKTNVRAKLLEISKSLSDVDLDANKDSPRAYQETLQKEISKLIDIQKKILRLKTESGNTL